MDPKSFDAGSPGELIRNLDGNLSFVPNPLPPAIEWNGALVASIARATQSIAQLIGFQKRFPEPVRLIRLFQRREAELSSRIEQTYATVRQMLIYERAAADPNADVQLLEVQNNYLVLRDGLNAIVDRPITLGLLRHLHEKLFEGLDAAHVHPGRFRSIPVFIGSSGRIADATYVPPPPLQVEQCMRDLEQFVRNTESLPPIVRAALVHYQFEAIHPFNDGNGRIGRALIMLMLVSEGLLAVPLLNPSAALERDRKEYYRHLLGVSLRGQWAAWIEFFCDGVADEATHSSALLGQLDELRVAYLERISQSKARRRLTMLVDELFAEPAQTAASVAKCLSITPTSANQTIKLLVDLKILTEVTGRQRDRVFLATEIVDLFTTPPSPR